MPELMFVLKSLAIALVVTICLQVKVGNSTLENRAYNWMRSSPAPQFIQEVSSGAVLFLQRGAQAASEFVAETFGNNSSLQKAGRLNFEFKRSPQYLKEHQDQQN